MRATGIVRSLDNLGRIVIPRELRRTLGLEVGDGIEIFTENNTIIFKKYEPTCIFCGEGREIVNYKGKNICKSCRADLKK